MHVDSTENGPLTVRSHLDWLPFTLNKKMVRKAHPLALVISIYLSFTSQVKSFSHQQHWTNPFRTIIDSENKRGMGLISFKTLPPTMKSHDCIIRGNISLMFDVSNSSWQIIMKSKNHDQRYRDKNETKGKRNGT